MKSLWEKLSVTKLVLLLLILCLIFIEIWNVVRWGDIDQLFTDVVVMVVSYYFAQKWIKYDSVDSIVNDEQETLDTNDIEKNAKN